MAVCDRDCFSCPFPDCIMDDVTAEERRSALRLDARARAEALEERQGAGSKAERERERARIKYYKYHDKYLERKKAWRGSHKEERRVYQQRYYQEHKEERRDYQREYARRKREEMRGDT